MKYAMGFWVLLVQVGMLWAGEPGQPLSLLGERPNAMLSPGGTGLGYGALARNPVSRETPPEPAPSPRERRPAVPPKPEGWLSSFLGGFVHGVTHALPNLWSAFKESPIKTTAMVAGLGLLGIASPPLAVLAGGAALSVGAYQAGSDPRKLGELAGETAFFGAAGAGTLRVAQRVKGVTLRNEPFLVERRPTPPRKPTAPPLPEAPRTARASRLPPVLPGERFDKITELALREGQQFHGQRFDFQTRRPIAALPTPGSREAGEAAVGRRTMTHDQLVDFAIARVRVARHDADSGRAAPWVRELHDKGLADWTKSGLDPYTMQRKYWSQVNGGPGVQLRGRDENCAFTAWAGDETLAGRPIAAPRSNHGVYEPASLGTPRKFLQVMYKGVFETLPSREALEARVLQGGEGSRGIVGVRVDGCGHVFNAVVHKGKVYFLDFGNGRPASFPEGTEIRFLKTT